MRRESWQATRSGYVTLRRSEAPDREASNSWPIRFGKPLLVLALSLVIGLLAHACEPEVTDAPQPLVPGDNPGHLEAGGEERYVLELEDGESVLLEIDQQHFDLEVEVLDPRGRRMLLLDTPVARNAPERLCFVASGGGTHTLRLTPFSRAAGDFTASLLRRRPATTADRRCFEAVRRFADAEAQLARQVASAGLVAEYETVARLWESAEEPFLAGLALLQAGTLQLRLGRSAAAIESYRQGLALARKAGSAYLEGNLLNRKGLAQYDRGELAAAEEDFLWALGSSRRGAFRVLEASALNNLALVDENRGELHLAIDRYREALTLWRQLGSETDLVQTLINLANAYALLDHHREALPLLHEAVEIARGVGDRDQEARVLGALGWVHHLRGRPHEAVPVLRESLELWRKLEDVNRQAAVRDRLGSALMASGDFEAALEEYQSSLALSRQSESPRDVASTINNIGCLYAEWGRSDDALEQLAAARGLFADLDDPKTAAHLEYCAALAEHRRGKRDAALERITAALGLVDGLRDVARQRGERYRPIWLWQDYSELEIELLMEEYRATDDEAFAVRAFEASDLARARNFLELVIESRNRTQLPADEELRARLRQLQQDLNAAQQERRRLVAARGSAAEIADSERRIGEFSLKLESARANIRAAREEHRLQAPEPVALRELQRLLDPQTTLLSYVFGKDRSYLFTVGRETFKPWDLERKSRLNAHAQTFYNALRQSRFGSLQHLLAGRALAEMLIPKGAIADESRRLLVLAADLLHYVPFAVLPFPGEQRDLEEHLLGDDFEILYLPSASVLASLRQRDSGRPPAPRAIAVYADAVFSTEDSRLSGAPQEPAPAAPASGSPTRSISAERLPEGPLPRLIFTCKEAEEILALVSATDRLEALGFAATKQRVLEDPLHLYRIIHFATHAQIDEPFPELSGLVLSRFDREGRPIDGDLHLHEIYGLRLASELVVLSGCQTALGQRVRGNGLLSMTRGFLYAGSSQVLVSLWSVDDEATAALMSELYRGLLLRGESPAAALRSTQRWMRQQERWSAPYFWGAFVLQGDG